jgi:methionyl-tRNA synthetase
MLTKFAADHPPRRDDQYFLAPTSENPYGQLEVHALEACKLAAVQFEACAPSRALEIIWRFVGVANRFIDQTQPWAMAKQKHPALGHALWCLQSSLWLIARLIEPVLPATSRTLRTWIGDTAPMHWPEPVEGRVLVHAPADLHASPPMPLFPRLDDKAQHAIVTKVVGDAAAAPPVPAAPKAPPAPPRLPAPAPMRERSARRLREARRRSADLRPALQGEEAAAPDGRPRRGASARSSPGSPGIRARQIVGEAVIVVANLAPATIRGISRGMIWRQATGRSSDFPRAGRRPPGTRVR